MGAIGVKWENENTAGLTNMLTSVYHKVPEDLGTLLNHPNVVPKARSKLYALLFSLY